MPPPIPQGSEWLWRIFSIAGTERTFTMGGAGPIPFTKIYEVAHILGYDQDDCLTASLVCNILDNKFLQIVSKKQDADRKKTEAKLKKK